jgi:aryl-alcohol dehydrogenase-like predicted oxidoreductase
MATATLHKLKPIPIGNEGIIGSRIGIGTWAIGGGWGPQPDDQSLEAITVAIERGCQLIDTAPLYGNGRAERLIACTFSALEKRVTVLTKIVPFLYRWAPAPGTPMREIYPSEHIITETENSLRRLKTDCLDCLLFQTWCPTWYQEDYWYEVMQSLQRQGKIRSFGISVSDHRPDEANEVIRSGRVAIIEAPYNILDQRAATRLFPLAQEHHISVIARNPLASGVLSGRWSTDTHFHRRDWRKRVFRGALLSQTIQRVEKVKALFGQQDHLAPIAIRFCLSHPAISVVIPGIRSDEQAAYDLAPSNQRPLARGKLSQLTRLWHEEFSQNVRTSIGEEGEGDDFPSPATA